MKKYLIICFCTILIIFGMYYIRFYTSFVLFPFNNVTTFIKTEDKKFVLNEEKFSIKAVNLSSSVPGIDDVQYVSKDTYLRWFEQIQEMNINTIRVYTIEPPKFYEALKEYNMTEENPLYLIQGIDAQSYEKNSSVDYFDDSLRKQLIKDVKMMIDVIHGKRIIIDGSVYPSGNFFSDVSDWTIGYIIGTEWSDITVEYTNVSNPSDNIYYGKYLKTTQQASPFERILAEVGDKLIQYESERYGEQKLLSFGNTPFTDPFTYNETITDYFNKFTEIDINNIETTEDFKSGLFASYQVYSNYPDYYSMDENEYEDTYYEYLNKLNTYYDIPVVISEFGYSTSRASSLNGIEQFYTEEQQGHHIVSSINTMKKAGISGFIIQSWQDEWDKNAWNTMHSVDTSRSKYWYDVQTSSQSFGIMSFDTGKDESIVTLDGKNDEWNSDDVVFYSDIYKLSAKYDEAYLYLLVEKQNLDFDKDEIYIPIDTTIKSGSKIYSNESLIFDKDVDFIIKINGKNNSKIMVQQYYNTLRAIYGKKVYSIEPYEKDNIPSKDIDVFEDINLITSTQNLIFNTNGYQIENIVSLINTGTLTYGIGNPNSQQFNSLSDFYSEGNIIELRIPWQILNFSDPSKMMIHDDYYQNYGVESYIINQINLGIGNDNNVIELKPLQLKGWNEKVTYHERLKKSYYIIKEALGGED